MPEEKTRADLEGAEAVVIGRSNLFGKPMAASQFATQFGGNSLFVLT